MRTRLHLVITATILLSCSRKQYKTNAPSINLFGFEESQVHHIHSNLDPEKAVGRIFLVRYDPRKPHDLEWINCPIEVEYKYHASDAPRVEEMQIRTSSELHGRLPLSIARYQGIIEAGSELIFHYITVGAFELLGVPALPKKDHDCNRATHYVTTLSVGAFSMAEQKERGIASSANLGDINAGVSHSRSQGQSTTVGNLDACTYDERQLGCRTPLQIRLEPIPRRWWFDGDLPKEPASTPPYPTEHSLPETELAISKDEWRPGHYMALALNGILQMATELEKRSDFGWDSDASTIAGGYLGDNEKLRFSRNFSKGEHYVVFGWGDGSDVDIAILDERGSVMDADFQSDGMPVVEFRPAKTAKYELIVQSAESGFVSLAVMREGGIQIGHETVQKTFQDLLDGGVAASRMVQEAGYPGLVFHEGGLALLGTILKPGEAIRQSGVKLEEPTLFLGLAHGDSDIDLAVESTSKRTWKDDGPEAVAITFIDDPSASEVYSYRLSHPSGKGPVLGASLLLKARKRAEE